MRTFLLAFAAAIATFSASAQNGLIARYLLNNNADDAVGSNHGTIVGATPTADRFGQVNAAYSFNGSSSRIEFSAPPPFTQAASWTLSAWIRPSNFTHVGLAVYVGLDNGASSDGFGFGLNNSSALQGFLPFAAGFVNSGAAIPSVTQWTHVVMLRTNNAVSFYINGVKAPAESTVNVTAPSDFTIGSQNGTRYFNGSVDDIRVYNRAITTNEIAQIFAGNEGPCYPHAATATAVLFNGFVVAGTVTDGGCGYTNVPTVAITGGGGSNATATATVSNGIVTGINITGAGCCYTNPPKITISSPPFPTSVSIKVSKYAITQHVMIGRTYVLEGTSDFVTWVTVGSQYTAQSEAVVTDVDANLGYRFFRAREVTGSP